MRINQQFAACVFVTASLVSAGAQASLVSVDGNLFTLEYDSQAAQLAAIDELTVGQNSVKIHPTEYSVIATGPGADQDTLSGALSFTLRADSGYGFTGFDWLAAGDYILLSGRAAATLGASGTVTITDALDAGLSGSANAVFSDLTQAGFNTDWNATALIRASDISASKMLTEVSVTIDGSLLAEVEAGGIQAKMEMKIARLLFGIEPASVILAQQALPAPSTAFLLIGGLAVVGCRRLVRHAKA